MKKQSSKSFSRSDRIESKIQSMVAEILRDKYSEINITLTGAESSGGLQFIRLYYQGDKNIQKRLDGIKSQVRYELAARMDQKYTPDIRFVYDDTLEKSERIEKLLEGLHD